MKNKKRCFVAISPETHEYLKRENTKTNVPIGRIVDNLVFLNLGVSNDLET